MDDITEGFVDGWLVLTPLSLANRFTPTPLVATRRTPNTKKTSSVRMMTNVNKFRILFDFLLQQKLEVLLSGVDSKLPSNTAEALVDLAIFCS